MKKFSSPFHIIKALCFLVVVLIAYETQAKSIAEAHRDWILWLSQTSQPYHNADCVLPDEIENLYQKYVGTYGYAYFVVGRVPDGSYLVMDYLQGGGLIPVDRLLSEDEFLRLPRGNYWLDGDFAMPREISERLSKAYNNIPTHLLPKSISVELQPPQRTKEELMQESTLADMKDLFTVKYKRVPSDLITCGNR